MCVSMESVYVCTCFLGSVALELAVLLCLACRSVLTSTSPRKLHRQGSIYQRGHMVRQSTLPSPPDHTLYESSGESKEAENGEAGGYTLRGPMISTLTLYTPIYY